MTVVCVDDAASNLKKMTDIVHTQIPSADVYSFNAPKDALNYVTKNGCDVLLTEIELYDKSNPVYSGSYGLVIANEAAKINPQVNVVFVTVCDEHEFAKDVFDIRASGYVTKPYKEDKLKYELDNLRNPVYA